MRLDRRLQDLVPWLLGFVLVANAYVRPGAGDSPRFTDVAGLLLALWLLRRLAKGGLSRGASGGLLLLTAMPALWTGLAWAGGQRATLVMGARWLLAAPWALGLVAFAAGERERRALAWGLWWGLLVNVAVLVAQQLGGYDVTRRLGLAAAESVLTDVERVWRYSGMHGHANAAAAVASLIVPVGLWLHYRAGAGLWLPLASVLAALAGGHVTMARSPLLVAGAVIAAVAATSRQTRRTLRLAAAFLALVLPALLWFGPPGGEVRWTDESNITVNTAERLATNREGLRLIEENPFGAGVERSAEALEDRFNMESMHNAFLQLAAVFGLPMVIVLAPAMLAAALRLRRGIDGAAGLEAAIALQMLGLFFFEEHGNNPTFIILAAWLVASLAPRPAAGPRAAPEATPKTGLNAGPATAPETAP